MILECQSCHFTFDESQMDYFDGIINICKTCNRKDGHIKKGRFEMY